MPRKHDGAAKAGLDLLALIQAAASHGIEVQVRTYPPMGKVIFLNFILTEPDGEWATPPVHMGSADLWVSGSCAGEPGMYSVRGVGIALAREAGILDETRLKTFEAMAPGGAHWQSSPESQRELLARADRERDRRAKVLE